MLVGIKIIQNYYNSADVSVAVAIDKGLITPIIKSVENKGLETISLEMKQLIKKAKEGLLKPEGSI